MSPRNNLSNGSCSSATAIDRAVLCILDDLLDCVEVWHRAGCDDARWVANHWHRTLAPTLGVELPAYVRAAADARAAHEALLAWQTDVARR
jgi:hypothetical protein